MREELLQIYAFRKLGYGKNLVLLGIRNKEFIYENLPEFSAFEEKFKDYGAAMSVGDGMMIALKPDGRVEYQCDMKVRKEVTLEVAKLRAKLKN